MTRAPSSAAVGAQAPSQAAPPADRPSSWSKPCSQSSVTASNDGAELMSSGLDANSGNSCVCSPGIRSSWQKFFATMSANVSRSDLIHLHPDVAHQPFVAGDVAFDQAAQLVGRAGLDLENGFELFAHAGVI